MTFTSCTGPGGLRFTATTSASKARRWKLNASSFKNGVTKGTITGVTAALSGNGCTATVAGTSAKSPGKVTGSYSNSTHVLTVSGGNLHVWNVSSGCLGLIKTGNRWTPQAGTRSSPRRRSSRADAARLPRVHLVRWRPRASCRGA